MAATRIIYRGYAIEVRPEGAAYAVTIERVRPELSILGRRVVNGFPCGEQALEFAKGRIDRLLKG